MYNSGSIYTEDIRYVLITADDINRIFRDLGIIAETVRFDELQRYYYEKNDPESKEVRLIIKACANSGKAFVVRFKNESDAPRELIEAQCGFAQALKSDGISCPEQYRAGDSFTKQYAINGYDVTVAVEEFVNGELKFIDEDMAEKTGNLLAKTHNISEKRGLHVHGGVLFDPFNENDLFSVSEFKSACEGLEGEAGRLSLRIMKKYDEYMEILAPLRSEPKFAVQGDISLCNTYMTEIGELGIYDFNRCGDNNLFCDAVMQAVFEARLMDYPKEYEGKSESLILPAFIKGYESARPFTDAQRGMFPYLYAIINAFWSADIVWNDDSLSTSRKDGNMPEVRAHLEAIWERLQINGERALTI